MRRFFTALCTALLLTASASAGPVYLSLVIDPPTFANAAGNDGTSARSGPGTWQLFAFDDTDGSLGIASYSVTMSGITQVLNRSPSTLFDPDGGGDQDAGFRLLRSANDITPPVGAASNPITGAQPLPGSTSINPILGFGRAASDFTAKLPPGSAVSSQTSPSWGDYATDPPSFPALTGLFLAEGNYTLGTLPAITAARLQLYTNGTTFSVTEAQEVVGNPPATPPNTPPSVNDVVFPGYNNNEPGEPQTLVHQFTATDLEDGAGPFVWGNSPFPTLLSYTPNYGGVGPGPVIPATMTPGGLFSWVSEGSPRGDYVWQVQATDSGGLTDLGTITVNANFVPEPTTLSLLGLALVGAMGLFRRRNG